MEKNQLSVLDLVSQIKRMHQNIGVNAFKMQVELTGSGSWSAAFVIIDIPARFLFEGGVCFLENTDPRSVWTCTSREGSCPCTGSASVFGGALSRSVPCPWHSGGFQRASETRVPGWGRGPGQLLEVGKVSSKGTKGSVLLQPSSGAGGGSRAEWAGLIPLPTGKRFQGLVHS